MLKFIYTDAKGVTAEWALTRWRENSLYIQGRSETDSLPRTFRKDRVQQYLCGEEQLLFDNAPPAPLPAPRSQPDDRPQILFTGFASAARKKLELTAETHGFRVMKTVSKSLSVLCIGGNAGPSKVEMARSGGAFVLDETETLLHAVAKGAMAECIDRNLFVSLDHKTASLEWIPQEGCDGDTGAATLVGDPL